MVVELKTKRTVKPSAHPARKKVKTQHLSTNDLPWKSVHRAHEAGLDSGHDGIMELEEVEDVEVVYEETETGRVAKFNVRSRSWVEEHVLISAVYRFWTRIRIPKRRVGVCKTPT